ncbi:MAG: DUF3888 domain-containing protein [Clostridia bacterium]|nr:DUF3888 domain-containing protein [Clostridia bacterium]MCI9246814.1 DUF3888 domain-containing protein [Clostridia bacterium]
MKKIVFLVIFVIFCVILSCIFYRKSVPCSSNTIERNKYDQAIINTYLDKISSASNDFYDEYYTKLPSVMYYTVSIKDIVSEKSNSIITFNSYPYLGPHDTIGIDEITFVADYMGNVKLQSFNHIVSYHLPDNLRYLEKKIIPGKYE